MTHESHKRLSLTPPPRGLEEDSFESFALGAYLQRIHTALEIEGWLDDCYDLEDMHDLKQQLQHARQCPWEA